ASETVEMLQIAFGDTYMSHSKIYEWYSRFKNGRTSVEDDPRAGRPSTSTTKEKKEEIEALLQENHRSTIRKLSEEVGISIGSYQTIVERLTACPYLLKCLYNSLFFKFNFLKNEAVNKKSLSEFLTAKNMMVIPHPPYSADLVPRDFFLFSKMKLKLKGRRFDIVAEIQTESQQVLDTLGENDFQQTFQAWQHRWDRCINAGGDYFEGDTS
ncbi:Putative uncharacterized protein FLJ37770, partial [Habropoda laboriosa]